MTLTTDISRPGQTDPVKKVAVHGGASLRFEKRDGQTRLAELYHHDPLRWLLPEPRRGDLPIGVLVTTSGGMVGGDRLDVTLSCGPEARALITTQAAEKVYRSTGANCLIETDVRVEDGGWLEWVPQEAITFEGSRLRRNTRLVVEGTGRMIAGEMLVFGRAAFGETVTRGLVRDAWEVRLDGRLIWADALHLDGDIGDALAHPAGFAGAGACATLLLAGRGSQAHLQAGRDLAEQIIAAEPERNTLRIGVTAFDNLLVVRILGTRAEQARTAYARMWSGLRQTAAGLPTRLPRLWEI